MAKISVSDWSGAEEEYFLQMDKIFDGVTSKEVAEVPFVYSSRQKITSSLTGIDLFRKVLNVQGSIVECGVHKGNNLFLFNHLSTILEPYNFNRKIIGFDTFEGFRSLSVNDDDKLSKTDFSDTDFNKLNEVSSFEALNRAVSHIQKIELVKGDATNKR